MRLSPIAVLALVFATLASAPAMAQAPNGVALQAEQREKLAPLSWLDGTWRGTAVYPSQNGPITITQTERVGPMLAGTIRVIEGRGYNSEGNAAFNAFAVLAWNTATKAFEMHAFNDGRSGVYPLVLTPDGFGWEIPAGPGKVRFEATFKDGEWREVGTFEMPGRPPRQTVEMRLRRIGPSDWPAAGAVPRQ